MNQASSAPAIPSSVTSPPKGPRHSLEQGRSNNDPGLGFLKPKRQLPTTARNLLLAEGYFFASSTDPSTSRVQNATSTNPNLPSPIRAIPWLMDAHWPCGGERVSQVWDCGRDAVSYARWDARNTGGKVEVFDQLLSFRGLPPLEAFSWTD